MEHYLVAMGVTAGLYAIMALGMNVIWGKAGLINLGLVVFVGLVLVAIFAPLIAPYGYDQIGDQFRQPPSAAHWFGTDNIGRDVFSRVVYGARVSLVIGLLAVPIVIQVYLNAGLAYWLNRTFGVAWCVAAPAALIGASNFFELSVAAAISLFGLNSGAALATVVGVLVEVPVMLSVVHIVKASRGWYEAGAKA